MIDALRQHLARLEKRSLVEDGPAMLPLDIPAVDGVLGGGLARGALHEIAAAGEACMPAATGFALGLAAHAPGNRHIIWVAEDMALAESGGPYGAGLGAFGLDPQRLVIVSVAHRPELMAAMEDALRCRAVGAVIGEVRHGALDAVAIRRLSLAAGDNGALGFLLRAQPMHDASTAATRWTAQASPSARTSFAQSFEIGAPRFAVDLTRNRRGPAASWILEWRNPDERFALAAHAEPVATPLRHRPHRKVA